MLFISLGYYARAQCILWFRILSRNVSFSEKLLHADVRPRRFCVNARNKEIVQFLFGALN